VLCASVCLNDTIAAEKIMLQRSNEYVRTNYDYEKEKKLYKINQTVCHLYLLIFFHYKNACQNLKANPFYVLLHNYQAIYLRSMSSKITTDNLFMKSISQSEL
jgi:hypothetical protein